MATRRAEMMAIAKRCEKVGWPVDYGPPRASVIRVTLPDGAVKGIHKSPSDVNAGEALERELNRHGLAKLEREQALRESLESKARTVNGRAKAEEKIAEINAKVSQQATNQAMLNRAAGPYMRQAEAPDVVGIQWYADQHPAPWMRWVELTPEIARYLLAHHNLPGKAGEPGTNRPQQEARIHYYRDLILSNQWHLTHQGMAMDTEAKLQDGQHRLAAILAAEKMLETLRADIADGGSLLDDLVERLVGKQPANRAKVPAHEAKVAKAYHYLQDLALNGLKVPAAFFVGMSTENFKAIDDGLARDAGQMFAKAGERNAPILKGAARLIVAYRSGDPRFRARRRISMETSIDLLDELGDDLRRLTTVAATHAKKVPMPNAAFAAGMYLIGEANGFDNLFYQAFLTGTFSGLKSGTRIILDDNDPRMALRRTIEEKRRRGPVPGLDYIGLLLMSWNYLVQGKHLQTYRWVVRKEALPGVVVCDDFGDRASAIPRALVGEITPEMIIEHHRALAGADA